MKRRLLIRTILLTALLSAACGGWVPLLRAAQIDGSLTYVYASGTQPDANNNWPACTATLTTECVTGFKVYDITSGTPVLLGTVNNAPNPTGQQTMTFSFATPSGYAYGQHQAVATASYVNSSGASGESAYSAPATFTYSPPASPNAPATLTIKVQ